MILSRQHFEVQGKIILEKVQFQPPLNANSTMHNEACFLHVVRGKSRLYSPTQNLSVQSQDNLLMKCGHYLNKWFQNENAQPNEAVLIHFYPDILKWVYQDRLPDFFSFLPSKSSQTVAKIETDQIIQNYMEQLLYCFEHPQLVNDEFIKIKIQELIFILTQSQNNSQIITILNQLFHPTEYAFKDVIHKNIFEDLSLNDLATICGMSLSSFKRKFRTVFNTSPKNYIIEQRLLKAAEYLKNSSLRISEIALECGFNDMGYFSKSFSSKFEYSPTDYRKLHLNQLSH